MAEAETLTHTAICVHDLKEAEDFYVGLLGAEFFHATNFITEDTIKGRSIHRSYKLSDYRIELCMAADFMPMPPEDQLRGAHGFRHAFMVRKGSFEAMMARLRDSKVKFQGPVDHPEKGPFGQSVYFKDPSGNFLEIVWRRDENVQYAPVPDVAAT